MEKYCGYSIIKKGVLMINKAFRVTEIPNRYFLLVFILSQILVSCEVTGLQDTRRPIENLYNRVCLIVNLDWSQSMLDDQDFEVATVWFFPEDGGIPRVMRTNERTDSIYLDPGVYHILAFNGTENASSHPNLSFTGTNAYNRFEVDVNTLSRSESSLFGLRVVEQQDAAYPPDLLSAARDTIELVRLQNTTYEVTLQPRPVTAVLTVIAHIQNMNYTASGGHLLSVSGMAKGAYLASLNMSSSPVTHIVLLNNRAFGEGGQANNGTMSARLFMFGFPVEYWDGENILQLSFTLIDGSIFKVERNVTGRFKRDNSVAGFPLALILEIGGDEDDCDCNLPIIIPEVDGNSDGGFQADVDNWGPDVIIHHEI